MQAKEVVEGGGEGGGEEEEKKSRNNLPFIELNHSHLHNVHN